MTDMINPLNIVYVDFHKLEVHRGHAVMGSVIMPFDGWYTLMKEHLQRFIEWKARFEEMNGVVLDAEKTIKAGKVPVVQEMMAHYFRAESVSMELLTSGRIGIPIIGNEE